MVNFVSDPRQVQAERISFLPRVTCAKRRGPGGPQRFNSVCVCVCVCVCVRYQTPCSSRHESGPSLFLSIGKHPVVGQLPPVYFSALPGQSSDRPNLPPHPSAITALFLDRSLVVVHLTGHDQIMTVEILRTMAIASPQSGQATARGLPEVFHVSGRSRRIA